MSSTKRVISSVLAFMVVSVGIASQPEMIRTTVDDVLVNFPDVQPMMMKGRVMVPLRGVFEHMNAFVEWDEASQTATAQRGSDTVNLKLNSYTAMVNGKDVSLDAPAVSYQGRTMVPLRFLGEAMGATVEWVNATSMVKIRTGAAIPPTNTGSNFVMMQMVTGTVIPFQLGTMLTSQSSKVGDKFVANLDTNGSPAYQSMPIGSVLEGHVDVVKARDGETPGVLGLAFDRMRLPDGQSFPIFGTLIGLDSGSVIMNENGRWVAKPGSKTDDLKYVGYGGGAGALIAVLTKGNVITSSLIGAALGFLYGEIQRDPAKSGDVKSDIGTRFGVKLTRDISFRGTASNL